MKTIMDYCLTFLMAADIVVAVGALVYAFAAAQNCTPQRAPARRDNVRAVQTMTMPGVSCAPDGVAITTETALRYAVTQLDVTLQRGRDVSGNKMTPQDVTHLADGIAREFPAPDVMLAMLDRCEARLVETHPHGYWLLSSALVREAARRRAQAAQPQRAQRGLRAGA
jgi:hypothetical protein